MSDRKAELLAELTRTGLYLVTDHRLPLSELLAKTEEALQAGTRVVQYRDKSPDRAELLARATDVGRLCARYSALFLINDHLDLALASSAHGLHVGQDDFPAERARPLLDPGQLLGLSVSAVDEAIAAVAYVDYLGVGAMYPTDTKLDAEYGGLELLRAVRSRVDKPLVAIGGITVERAGEVLEAGADAVAVVSAIYSAKDPGRAVERFLAELADARVRIAYRPPGL